MIQDNEADYCLTLKVNHKLFYEAVMDIFTLAETKDWQNIEHSFYRTIEKGHGRTEIRRYWKMSAQELLFEKEQWFGLKSHSLA